MRDTKKTDPVNLQAVLHHLHGARNSADYTDYSDLLAAVDAFEEMIERTLLTTQPSVNSAEPLVDMSPIKDPEDSFLFCKAGDYWDVAFKGLLRHISDQKGMKYFPILLANPNKEFSHLSLMAVSGEFLPVPPDTVERAMISSDRTVSYGETNLHIVDSKTLSDLQARLRAIVHERQAAEDAGNTVVLAAIDEESRRLHQFIEDSSFGGRPRNLKSQAQSAKKAVGTALDRACKHLAANGHEALAFHLRRSIRFFRSPLIYTGETLPAWRT